MTFRRPHVNFPFEMFLKINLDKILRNTTIKYHAVFLDKTIQLFQLRRVDSLKNLRSIQVNK